jgi:hypothetical protein
MKSTILKWLIFIIFLVAVALICATQLSCKSFKPERFDNLPEECNIMYSTMRLVSHKDHDKSLADDPMEWCQDALKQRRKDCLDVIYQDDKINSKDVNKYMKFNKCLSGIKIE